jgi:2',3'-cyclic-nucleotide 2'-phosphodiesterase (5'-nucleotidase family)
MGEVIAEASVDYIGGRPVSSLGNWVTDALFANQTKFIRLSTPVFCLLNTGGLRASINKGPVTLGDLYKLMPFDNEVVWVHLPSTCIQEIEQYLKTSGGEPLSNATVSNSHLKVNGWRDTASSFWVITSDYLLNGGDKMTFFQKKIEVKQTGKLLRDALIEEARFQEVLHVDSTIRILWD